MFGLSLDGVLWGVEGAKDFRVAGEFADSYRWLTATGGSGGEPLADALARAAGDRQPLILSLSRPAEAGRVEELKNVLAGSGVRLTAVIWRPFLAGLIRKADNEQWFVDADPDGLFLTRLGADGKPVISRTVSADLNHLLFRQRQAVVDCVRDMFSLDLGEPGKDTELWLDRVLHAGSLRNGAPVLWKLEGGGTLRIEADRLAGRLEAVIAPMLRELSDVLTSEGPKDAPLLVEGKLGRRFDLDRLLAARCPNRAVAVFEATDEAAAAAKRDRAGDLIAAEPAILAEAGGSPPSRELSPEDVDSTAVEHVETIRNQPATDSTTGLSRALAMLSGGVAVGILLGFLFFQESDVQPENVAETLRLWDQARTDIERFELERDQLLEETAEARADLERIDARREVAAREVRVAETRLAEFEEDFATLSREIAALLRDRVEESAEAAERLAIRRDAVRTLENQVADLESRLEERQREFEQLSGHLAMLRNEEEEVSGELLRLREIRTELVRTLTELEGESRRLTTSRNQADDPGGRDDGTIRENATGRPVVIEEPDRAGKEVAESGQRRHPWITPVSGTRSFGYEIRIPIKTAEGEPRYAYEALAANDVTDMRGFGRVEDLVLSNERVLYRLRGKYPDIDFGALAE